jgi:hypothetical protein
VPLRGFEQFVDHLRRKHMRHTLPKFLAAEQFRQVRTRLQHASSLETTRSILVTSPGPGTIGGHS